MQLTIDITPRNKEKVFKLISELLEFEGVLHSGMSSIPYDSSTISAASVKETAQLNFEKGSSLLAVPTRIGGLPSLRLGPSSNLEKERPGLIGMWGQVNSLYPIQSACRIASNLMLRGEQERLRLDEFVSISIDEFKKRGLRKFRGFPSTDKDTAKGRYVWHFLEAGHEMGLFTLSHPERQDSMMPGTLNNWEQYRIGLSDKGLEFAILGNDVLDRGSNAQLYSADERKWILSFLRSIDKKGYKEYSLLRDVYSFLKAGHNGKDELRSWFEKDDRFVSYIRSWSKKVKSNDSEKISKQLTNLASTFAASKVALLREFGLLDPRRNNYTIIGELQ